MLNKYNEAGKLNLAQRTSRKRKSELFQAAIEINGATEEDPSPAYEGLIDTLESKVSAKKLSEIISKKNKIKKSVVPLLLKKETASFENSHENMLRSICIYYGKAVCGKKKYRSMYKHISFIKNPKKKENLKRIKIMNCPMPRIVPCHKLVNFVKSIDIGSLHSVKETLCHGLDEDDQVSGVYRDLPKFLVQLATFYLTEHNSSFQWFGEENRFKIIKKML